MSGHPFREHRAHAHERDRVSKIAGKHSEPKHYARGGSVHDDEAEDRALIRKEVKSSALKEDGKKAKHRADKSTRRAKGGRVHKGKSAKTNVNVIVAPGGQKPPMGAPMAGIAPPIAAAPPMPPKPPMAAPAPGPMPPAGLGGMPPRAKGGRVHEDMERHHKGHKIETGSHAKHAKGVMEMPGKRARGGKVEEGKKSLADKRGVTGIGERTPIQHSGNKSDTQNIGRGPVITKATGGPIYADGRAGKEMGPKLNAGSNSGIGRMRKNKLARHEHWEA